MRYGSNEGYALKSMEKLFYDAGVCLAEENKNNVHFSFTSLSRGQPKSLPAEFKNIIEYDYIRFGAEFSRKFSDYVRRNNIQLVVAFDMLPIHPLCEVLRKLGVKAIVAYWGAPVSSLMPYWKVAIKRILFRFARSKVDGLIFESTDLANMAVNGRGIPARMVDVVPLGVDTSYYKPGKSNYAHKVFGFPENRRIIISAGHVYEGKGPGVLVDAAIRLLKRRKCDDVCFLICGNKGSESDQYEKKYRGMGLDELICFGGYRTDMNDIYQSCYCGVVPSLVPESYAFSAVEMAATGLPVVASRIGGLKDSVIDGQTGVHVKPGDAEELADAVELMLDNPELAAKYGQAGHKRCEHELSLDAHRRAFVEVLRSRLERSLN
jgi:glycosyltransferase involved in cell wall biosynthesis